MDQSSQPYLRMLSSWIYDGLLNDPYHEFMVYEIEELQLEPKQNHKSIRNYWDKKFIIQEGNLFCLLSGLEEKVLASGKYIHLLKILKKFHYNHAPDSSSSEFDSCPSSSSLISFHSSPQYYGELIDCHYLTISSQLFQFLIQEEKIFEKLSYVFFHF